MSAFVHHANGITREVKNLGWLVRNLSTRTIDRLDLHLMSGGRGLLWAEFTDDTSYECEFADASVMVDWVAARRNLQGLSVQIYDEDDAFNWWEHFPWWTVGDPKPTIQRRSGTDRRHWQREAPFTSFLAVPTTSHQQCS